MEIGEFSAFFFFFSFFLSSSIFGKWANSFWSFLGKKEREQSRRKKPGEWAKARQKKCWGELRRGMKVKLSTTVTRYLPHPLLIFTFLVCVWPQSSGNHSDSAFWQNFQTNGSYVERSKSEHWYHMHRVPSLPLQLHVWMCAHAHTHLWVTWTSWRQNSCQKLMSLVEYIMHVAMRLLCWRNANEFK